MQWSISHVDYANNKKIHFVFEFVKFSHRIGKEMLQETPLFAVTYKINISKRLKECYLKLVSFKL